MILMHVRLERSKNDSEVTAIIDVLHIRVKGKTLREVVPLVLDEFEKRFPTYNYEVTPIPADAPFFKIRFAASQATLDEFRNIDLENYYDIDQ